MKNGGIGPENFNFDSFLGPSFSMNVYDHDQQFPYIPGDLKDGEIAIKETAEVEPEKERYSKFTKEI